MNVTVGRGQQSRNERGGSMSRVGEKDAIASNLETAMLKVNIGLSRKLTRDFNSHGFAINLEGEIGIDLQDVERVVDKIQELYDLGEEALLRQIERYDSDSAIASHDGPPALPHGRPLPVERPNGTASTESTPPATTQAPGEPATNKQIQFLLSLGKRLGLTKPQLEGRLAELLDKPCGVYELTKRDAGMVLNALTEEAGQRRSVRA